MLVGTANIITAETHLDKIGIREIHKEVQLLVGTNASKLLVAWDVVNS